MSRRTHSLKRFGDGLLRHLPEVKKGLRKVYVRVNTLDELEEKLRPEARRELDTMFRDSNLRVAEVLRARGYASLPPGSNPS